MTPDSIVLSTIDEFSTVGARLGFPVFVKGAIKSNKDQGWAACMARDSGELETIGRNLLSRERRSRGKIIARRLVSFRAIDIDKQSFPIGREYRVFVHGGDVLAYGFYWDEYSDTFGLGPETRRPSKPCRSRPHEGWVHRSSPSTSDSWRTAAGS